MKKYMVAAVLAGAIGAFAQMPNQPQAARGNQTAKAASTATVAQCRKWFDDQLHLFAAGAYCASDTLGSHYHLIVMYVQQKLEDQCLTHINRQNNVAQAWQKQHPAHGLKRFPNGKEGAAVKAYCAIYRNHVEEAFVEYMDEGVREEIEKARQP